MSKESGGWCETSKRQDKKEERRKKKEEKARDKRSVFKKIKDAFTTDHSWK
ncbi:MAG: hypothetical protein WAV11_02330 [Minisyncoccia bacterium]